MWFEGKDSVKQAFVETARVDHDYRIEGELHGTSQPGLGERTRKDLAQR